VGARIEREKVEKREFFVEESNEEFATSVENRGFSKSELRE